MMYKRGLSMFLAAVLLIGMLPILGVPASAATLQERQAAVTAVALAYFDKGHSVQYDGENINGMIHRSDIGKTRTTNKVSPEYATPHETMYTVCSDFAHQMYYEAFRWELLENAGKVWTKTLAYWPKDDPMTVWYFDKAEGKDREKEILRMLTVAQPGDIFSVYGTKGGHTMVYVGDVAGDGKAKFIHSYGHSMNLENSKRDHIEYKDKNDPRLDARHEAMFLPTGNGGNIRLDDAETVAANYIDSTKGHMTLLRPLNVVTEKDYPTTASAKYRVSHPRLAIDRTLNKTRFNSAYTGETVTMTIELSNSSKQSYTVPVTEKAPVGAKIKTPFAGAKVSGDSMTVDVTLGAGEKKTLTAEFEITAVRGERVVFDTGSVGDIPSNSIPIQVGGAKLTEKEIETLAKVANREYAQVLSNAQANNFTLSDVIYKNILGLNVEIPKFSTIAEKFTKKVETPAGRKTNVFLKQDEIKAEDIETYRMLVQTCWGGVRIWNQYGHERCTNPTDMCLEPGDVIFKAKSLGDVDTCQQLVYLGDGKYLQYNEERKTYPIVDDMEFFKCQFRGVYYVVRPTLSYDDIHTLSVPVELPAAKKIKFKDVRENDWFYSYVRKLVEDGTVSGMSETEFAPNGTLTYGQALKLIALAVGEKEPAKTGAHWASGWLTLAKSRGWLTEEVSPDAAITRLALCQIAAKAKKLTAQPSANPFTDTSDTAVLALNKAGIISGMTEKTFEPNGLLTRAQITKIISLLREV